MGAPGAVEPPTGGLGNLYHRLKTSQIPGCPLLISAKSCEIGNPGATRSKGKALKMPDEDAVDFQPDAETELASKVKAFSMLV